METAASPTSITQYDPFDSFLIGFMKFDTVDEAIDQIGKAIRESCFSSKNWEKNGFEILQDLNITLCIPYPGKDDHALLGFKGKYDDLEKLISGVNTTIFMNDLQENQIESLLNNNISSRKKRIFITMKKENGLYDVYELTPMGMVFSMNGRLKEIKEDTSRETSSILET